MKCPRCQKDFSKLRQPMIFPCGHSFCSLCFPEKDVGTCLKCGEEGKLVINYALYEEILKNKNAHIEKYIKVCLFGNADVGKSSLIKRIVDDEFEEYMNPTIGIDFRYKDVKVGNGYYRLQLWDSAGQEKYRSMVSQHLKGADIVFLVYDLSQRASENSLEYWFKELENHVNHANIFVLGNKLDQEKSMIMEDGFSVSELEKQHIESHKWKHMKLSCKTGQNVNQLFQEVLTLSKGLKTQAEGKKQSVVLVSHMNPSKIRQPKPHPRGSLPPPRNDCKC